MRQELLRHRSSHQPDLLHAPMEPFLTGETPKGMFD
jgi:hypothetical protein